MNIPILILCSIASSVLYRAGGLSKEQPYWIPVWMRKSWVRDWLCPFFCLLPLFLIHPHWVFIIVYGLMGAAFSTYWDKLFKYDNYYFSGFMLGVSTFPLLFIGFDFYDFFCRSIFLAISWGGFCFIVSSDHAEEHARGFFAAAASLFY